MALQSNATDWDAVEERWAGYLGSDGSTVDLPFGLKGTTVTTIQVPNPHYPGPTLAKVRFRIV